MNTIDFYNNSCPYCGACELSMITEKEEKKILCEKCKRSFNPKDSKKEKVGDTKEM
jgi:uncharacterized CHY-type Zn-finger protein